MLLQASQVLIRSWIVALFVTLVRGIELTFELPDNANQCFYEEITEGTESTIEMQVVTGGQYDVDMLVENPVGKELYKVIRKQYDSFTFKADQTGAFKVCFSNEFSTFSHKIVYMDWMVGDRDDLPNMENRHQALTLLESSAEGIHERLKLVDDYQTHHRLREATGRKRAEDLNERVMYWSIGQAGIIMFIAITQILILRSFFTDKRTGVYQVVPMK